MRAQFAVHPFYVVAEPTSQTGKCRSSPANQLELAASTAGRTAWLIPNCSNSYYKRQHEDCNKHD